MEIIEFTRGNPEWFWFIVTPIVVLIIALSIAVAVRTKSTVMANGIIIGCAGLFFFWMVLGSVTSNSMTLEEKERVASEVSEVVGFEVSEGEIDLMLDEKPVRGVFYLRDGDTLVVEEK